MGFKGLLSDHEVIFCGTAPQSNVPTSNWAVDGLRVKAAVETLVREHKVNFINLSLGFYFDDLNPRAAARKRALQRAIDYAYENGVLCICAAGNEPSKAVAWPARFANAPGVSGIGPVGIGPSRSLLKHSENIARTRGAIGTSAHLNRSFFLDPYTTRGEGVNNVGPSIGILMPFMDTTRGSRPFYVEFEGTSYAAPVALAQLACAAAADHIYVAATGRAKSERAVELLAKISDNLGLHTSEVGAGFPCRNL